jgi:hypothetical protein
MANLIATLLLLVLALLLAALVVVRRTLRRPVERITDWMRRLRVGEAAQAPPLPRRGLLAPLAEEAATLVRRLSEAEDAAGQEAWLRQLHDSLWTAERLRQHVSLKLQDRPLVVVANREPYRHVRRGGKVEC